MPKKSYGIILKVPKGTSAPAGYTLVRSTRQGNIYKKAEAAPVSQNTLDDLIASFGRMGVSNVKVQATDDLANALSKMTIGGKRTRKNRSARRKTNRRRR